MKLKYTLLICTVFLALVCGGCRKAPSVEPAADPQTESEAEMPEEAAAPPYLPAYQEILKGSPALEGEHEELYDASFDYEQNQEMFGDHYDTFALFDVDRDGLPELIALSTVNFRWTPVSVFTYADGRAVLLEDPLDAQAHGTFEQKSTANGAYITYFCEENHIHNVWRGADPMGNEVEENTAYALNGTTLTVVDCSVGETDKTVYFSDIAQANTAENADAMLH